MFNSFGHSPQQHKAWRFFGRQLFNNSGAEVAQVERALVAELRRSIHVAVDFALAMQERATIEDIVIAHLGYGDSDEEFVKYFNQRSTIVNGELFSMIHAKKVADYTALQSHTVSN